MRRLAFLWREIFVTAIELFRYWAVAIVRTVVETNRSSLNLQSINDLRLDTKMAGSGEQ